MSQPLPVHVSRDRSQITSLIHPLRRRVLQELEEPDSAAGVARRLGLDRQKVNYHVRQLEKDGLVEMVEERSNRGCTERVVRAVARSYLINPLTAGGSSGEEPSEAGERFSSAYLVAVAARVIADLARLRDLALRGKKRVATLTLETEVRFATASDQHRFAEELTREVARIAAKYQDDSATNGRSYRVIAGAYPVPPTEDEDEDEDEEVTEE